MLSIRPIELNRNDTRNLRLMSKRGIDRVKREQARLVQSNLRRGNYIPKVTGRLRKSMDCRVLQRGMTVGSNVVYYFQAERGTERYWRGLGRPRAQRAMQDQAQHEHQVRQRKAKRRAARAARRSSS